MRYLLYILLWVVPNQCFSQSLITNTELTKYQQSNEPLVIITVAMIIGQGLADKSCNMKS